MPKVISAHSLQRSWTYRNRSRVSGFVVLTAWAYVVLTRPWIPQHPRSIGLLMRCVVGVPGRGVSASVGHAVDRGAKKEQAGRRRALPCLPQSPDLGTFAMGIGLALFLKSLVFTGALGLLMLLYVWYVVPAEERVHADPVRGRLSRLLCAASSALASTGPASSAATRFFADPKTRRCSTANAGEWPAGCCWAALAQLTCHLRGTAWSVW